jgi:hypothetical protein
MIDEEIRPLILLLNEAPYIQTHSCCSGHPDDPSRRWNEGWIAMAPVGDFRAFWEFLDELQSKLNYPAERPFELFQQIDAETLFFSAVPLLDVYCNLSLGADTGNDIHVWNYLVNVTQEFLQEDKFISVKTAAEGADILTDKIHSTSYVQSDKTKFVRGYRVHYEAVWRYDSCKWCWDLVEYINERLFKILGEYDWFHALYSERNEELRLHWRRFEMHDINCLYHPSPFRARVSFGIRPIIEIKSQDVKRTREEHIQIWRLIELLAERLIKP